MRIEIFHNPEEKTNWNGLYSDQLINAIKTHFEVKNNQNKSLDRTAGNVSIINNATCEATAAYSTTITKPVKLGNDDNYVGEWKDGKKHGKGTYKYPNGDTYEGDWEDDKKHGKGTLFFADRDKYVGDWKDDKYNGEGIYYFADNRKYDGCWKDGKYNGKGIYYFADGRYYDGYWKDDKKHGKGRFHEINGKTFEQEWKDGNLKEHKLLFNNSFN